MKNLKVSLAWQILIAMVLGILLGSYLHYHSDSREWLVVNLLSPAGDIFIHLIKMIVVPIVISTLVVGIAGVGDAKQLGRIGAKTILYFEVITTVAIILGITLANVFQPGSGIDMSQLATVDISKYQSTTAEVQSHAHGLMGTILSLVPTNIVASMAKGDMLPIIFFSVLFGLGLSSLPATHREPLVTVFRSISETMFKVTHMVMRYAPVGVFALIAVTVANFGFASLWPLAKLVLKGTREVFAGAMSAETFAELQKHFDNEAMVDLTVTAAFYCAVVRTLASLAIDVEPEYQKYLDKYPFPG